MIIRILVRISSGVLQILKFRSDSASWKGHRRGSSVGSTTRPRRSAQQGLPMSFVI